MSIGPRPLWGGPALPERHDVKVGWRIVAPGLVATPAWRPDPEVVAPRTRLNGLAAVGRKPRP